MIYFIGCGDLVKIGTTARGVSARLSNLQTGNPASMVLLGRMLGDADVEGDLHRRFRTLHVRGEWFRRDDDLNSFIAGLDDLEEPYGLLDSNSAFFGLFEGKSLNVLTGAFARTGAGKWRRFHSGICPIGGDPVAEHKGMCRRYPEDNRWARRTVLCLLQNATRFTCGIEDESVRRLLRRAEQVAR